MKVAKFFIAFFIVGIIGVLVVYKFSNGFQKIFTTSTFSEVNKQIKNLYEKEDKAVLIIEVAGTSVNITKGNALKADTNNEYIKIESSDKKMYVKEETHITNKTDYVVNIEIPEDMYFDGVYLNTGAGKNTIDTINTDLLIINTGAGEMSYGFLSANTLDANLGAGKFEIKDSIITKSNFDLGIGEFNFKGFIEGDTKINAGVGEINLDIKNSLDDFKLDLNKGVGTILVDGESYKSGKSGTGPKLIDIDGGVGSIKLNFNQK